MLYVVKLGGGAGLDPAASAPDIADLVRRGERVVLVHGCSHTADRLADELGEPARYVTSAAGIRSRYTDARALRVFMLAAGLVNAQLVAALQRLGVPALGLSGLDGCLLRGRSKDALRIVENGRVRVLRGDFTGRVERVNVELLRLLLGSGYVPVIAPLALAESGDPLNVDGDRAAAAVAAALDADTLVILSNVPGLLADTGDERSLIPHLAAGDLAGYQPRVTGGMRRKLMGAGEALRGGVRRVVLADGRVADPVTAALAGGGTLIMSATP